mgnify:CR=1 FL=1
MVLEKVRQYIKDKQLIDYGDTIIVAVSGGPDSLCLLHLLKTIKAEQNLTVIVAHLNHCLRSEADEEEIAVQALANEWNFLFHSRSVSIRDLKARHRISEEEAGRMARYQLLFDLARRYGASKIALGHHLDDQAETVLLNLLRGTGVDGLAGILPKRARKGFQLVRPLLCLTRKEIEGYCNSHQLQYFTDSSNLETNYKRNRLRLQLIPQLEQQYNPKIREALANLASLAAVDRRFLNNLAGKELIRISRIENKRIFIKHKELLALPEALSRRVGRLALKRFVPTNRLRRFHLEQLLELAMSEKAGRRLSLPGGIEARLEPSFLVIAQVDHEQEHQLKEKPLEIPGKTPVNSGYCIEASLVNVEDINWEPISMRAYLDYDELPSGQLSVRSRWPGARFYPQGAPGSQKLKKFMIDQKLLSQRRENHPLVTIGDEILWVVGYRIGHPYRVTDKTKRILQLEYKALKKPRSGFSRSI